MSFFLPSGAGTRKNQAFKESFWADLLTFARSRSGKEVTAATALEVTAVLACLRVLAEGVAQVPLNVYRRRKGGGADVAHDHPLYWQLHRRPNHWQTSFEFRENMMIQAGLAGNFYAFKNKVRGIPREIIPFMPGSVQERWSDKGVPSYLVTSPSGSQQEFPAEAIWHVRGPSWDTRTGMTAIRQAREAIGLSIATEEAHAKLHANGAQTSGVYSVDATLNPDQYKQLSAWIERQITGDSRYKPFVLDRGAKFIPNSMTGVDAQHLETRKFQLEEICRAFRVMPIMIGASDKTATYASAEQMFLAHVVHTLMPWYERIEQSMDVNLLTEEDIKAGIYIKFLPTGLLRGAAKDRAEYYYKMWQMGTLNANEIRAMEEQNPYLGGNIYRVQLNTVDATKADEQAPSVPA